jgi:hypothetical protein
MTASPTPLDRERAGSAHRAHVDRGDLLSRRAMCIDRGLVQRLDLGKHFLQLRNHRFVTSVLALTVGATTRIAAHSAVSLFP